MDSTLYFMHSSKQLLHFIKQEIISPAELFENINDWVQKNNHKIKYSSQVQGGKETLQQPSTPTSLQQQTGAQDFYGIVRWSILVKICYCASFKVNITHQFIVQLLTALCVSFNFKAIDPKLRGLRNPEKISQISAVPHQLPKRC